APVYSQEWQAGEVTATNWQTSWPAGAPQAGVYDFQVRVEDWAGRSATVPYTLTLVEPEVGFSLPPQITTTVHAEYIAPPPAVLLTSPEVVTLTAGAIAPDYLASVELYDLDVTDAPLYSEDWPADTVITTTLS